MKLPFLFFFQKITRNTIAAGISNGSPMYSTTEKNGTTHIKLVNTFNTSNAATIMISCDKKFSFLKKDAQKQKILIRNMLPYNFKDSIISSPNLAPPSPKGVPKL